MVIYIYIDVVKYLIEKGADFDSSDNVGKTPLHLVSRSGNLGAARYLIEKGANFNSTDSSGQTPLHLTT